MQSRALQKPISLRCGDSCPRSDTLCPKIQELLRTESGTQTSMLAISPLTIETSFGASSASREHKLFQFNMLMKLSEYFQHLDKATKEKLRYQVSQSALVHPDETPTAPKNPLMHRMMRHPHGQTLKQLEAFARSA
ncbi:hypothetical protein CC78DRAFT_611140 [Lojkania enalia]|uniref:Uncharacterized protein n=1 Tax=Lojkania enalia TaxID=147567 RepID=A0A9P4NDM0_9PLEO|nr:hypothetical protein CC78DRAFT_611140 [Didymosphaeria enalia]